MENKLKRISSFVSSLEREELSEDQQVLLLAGTNRQVSYDNYQCNNCGDCQGGNYQCNNC